MYGFEGLSIIFLFLFIVLSGSLAGGVERRSGEYRRDRNRSDREWDSFGCGFERPHLDSDRTAQLQVLLFRLAKRRGGTLTLSDIIVETGLGVYEAEELMKAVVDNTYIRIEVTDEGRVIYEFPELMEQRTSGVT